MIKKSLTNYNSYTFKELFYFYIYVVGQHDQHTNKVGQSDKNNAKFGQESPPPTCTTIGAALHSNTPKVVQWEILCLHYV